MKTCNRCAVAYPITEGFYKAKTCLDGYDTICKLCKQKYYRLRYHDPKQKARVNKIRDDYRKTPIGRLNRLEAQKRNNEKAPEKAAARVRVYHALKSGRLVRPDTCPTCGKEGRVNAHHINYTDPLNIIWVCNTCHAAIHSAIKPHQLLDIKSVIGEQE